MSDVPTTEPTAGTSVYPLPVFLSLRLVGGAVVPVAVLLVIAAERAAGERRTALAASSV